MPYALANLYGETADDTGHTRGCNGAKDHNIQDANFSGHCSGSFVIGTHKPKKCCKKKTRFHCIHGCSSNIQYKSGTGGHPCTGASHIEQIPINISGSTDKTGGLRAEFGNPPGAAWCRWDSMDAATLKSMSGDDKYLTGGISGYSVWDQLVIGLKKGSYNGEGSGFCEDANNIRQVVHNDGSTCYDVLARKVNEAAAKQKATTYCEQNLAEMKTDECSSDKLGDDKYIDLMKKYCETADGLSDEWCACYNAWQGKCDKSNASDYAGCTTVNASHNALINDIPEDALSGGTRQQLKERKHCRAKICDRPESWQPPNVMDNCNLNLQVCIQDVKVAGHLVDSGIEIKCDNTQNVGGSNESTDVNGGTKGGGFFGGAVKYQGQGGTTTINRNYIVSGGLGVTSSSVVSSMCCVLALAVMMGSSEE